MEEPMSSVAAVILVLLAVLASLLSISLLAALCHGMLTAIELHHLHGTPIPGERRLHAAEAGLHAGLCFLALTGM
jgi:hypothetical protein